MTALVDIAAVAVLMVLVVAVALIFAAPSAKQITKTCARHGGVVSVYDQQYVGTTGNVYAVCADRTVRLTNP